MAQWNSKKWARINWKNRPSTATALGATNLNKIDVFLNEVDNQLIDIDASKLNISTANSMIVSLAIDVNSGIITARQLDGTIYTWDLNLEKIPVSFTLSEDGVLTMTTEDGTQFVADIGELIKDYTFVDSDTIGFSKTVAGSGYDVTAIVKDGSIKEKHLDPNYLSSILQNMNTAQAAANDALTYSMDSKRWAVGDPEYEGSEIDNSKYYSEQAELAKIGAEKARDEAQAVSSVEIATTQRAGIVKPDGTTIRVDVDGTIHGADTTEIATTTQAGIVKPDGTTIGVAQDGTISSIIKAASLLITDTQGLKVESGQETTTQLLIDAITDKIVNHIVTNESLTLQLANYVSKTMITNQVVNDATKVTGAALSYAQQQEINKLNSNYEDIKKVYYNYTPTPGTAIRAESYLYIDRDNIVHGYISAQTSTTGTSVNMATIPVALRPPQNLLFPLASGNGSTIGRFVELSASNGMLVAAANSATSQVSAYISYKLL